MTEDEAAGTASGGRMIYAPVVIGTHPDGRPIYAKEGRWLPPAGHEKLDAGIGEYFAADLQRSIEGLGDRAAGKKLGLSWRAIRRLRARGPLEKVSIGFPRP